MINYYARFHSNDEHLHFTHKTSEAKQTHFHVHNLWELIYVKSGEVTYTVNDKRYHLGKNWLIITRPLDGHSVTYANAKSCERWVIQFEEKDLHCDVCKILPPELDVLDCNAHSGVLELLAKMDRYSKSSDREMAKEMLITLIQELLFDAKLMADSTDGGYMYQSNATVAQAIRFIKENIHRAVTVEEVAKHLYISAGYLQRLFLRHLQISPKQYILTLKLTFAHRDLCKGEKAIKVYPKYGFTDYSSFYRMFTKHFGFKPSETPEHQYIFSVDR